MQSDREPNKTENAKTKNKPWYHPARILKFLRKVDYLHTGAASLLGLERFIPQLEKFQANLGYLSIFLTVITIPINIFGVTYGLFLSEENKLNRFMRVVMAASSIALTAISIVAAAGIIVGAATILMMIGAAKGLFESVLRTGLAIYDRFFGQGVKDAKEIKRLREKIINEQPNPYDKDLTDLETLTNAQRKRNKAIANGLHVIAMNVVGVIAVGLLFGGITAVAGKGILIGLGMYGAADAVGLNPIKLTMRFINWTSRKVRGKPLFDPFGKKNKDELRAELAAEYAKRADAKFKQTNAEVKQVYPNHSNSEVIVIQGMAGARPSKPLPSKPLQPKPPEPSEPPANDAVIAATTTHETNHKTNLAALVETEKIIGHAAGDLKTKPVVSSAENEDEGDTKKNPPHNNLGS